MLSTIATAALINFLILPITYHESEPEYIKNKIENYDYKRKKVINEIIFEEYTNNFPRLISLTDFKKRKNMSIKVSNYISSHSFEDLNIFNPVDVE